MKRHWYSIEIAYMKNHVKLFSQQLDIGMICQSDILRQRTLKKQVAKFVFENESVKHLLCNGNLRLTATAYLGKFHNTGTPNFRQWAEQHFGGWITEYFSILSFASHSNEQASPAGLYPDRWTALVMSRRGFYAVSELRENIRRCEK